MITSMTFRNTRLLDKLLVRIYNYQNRYLRKAIRVFLLRQPGAEFYSKTLREIYSKYHSVQVGMYSYGAFDPILAPGTIIGRYTSIAGKFLVINCSHPVTHKSTHPFFYRPALGYVDKLHI